MLTSFFGKSAPINYLILAIVVCIGYLGVWYSGFLLEESVSNEWWFQLINLLSLIFSILLVDFVIRKNGITERHNIGIFLFTMLLLSSPQLVWAPKAVIAAVCSLLSFRRIISLGSERNVEKKILDASLWIGLGIYFVPATAVFLFLIYAGLLLHGKFNFRLSLVPIIGLTAVFSVLTSLHFIIEDSFEWFLKKDWTISFDFSAYNTPYLLIMSSVLLGLVIWLVAYRILRLKKIKRRQRPVYFTLLVCMLTGLVTALCTSFKNGSELIFVYAPFSMAMAEYIQNREKPIISELFLWGFALLPALILLQI